MALRGQGVSGLFRTVMRQAGWVSSLVGNRFRDSPASPVTVDEMPEFQDSFEHVVAPDTVTELIETLEINLSETVVLDKIQLNRQLCKRLEKKLAKARRHLELYQAATSMQKKQTLQELYFVVKRGEDLIRKCLCEETPWLHVAVTMADIKEDVLEIELDLSWWTKVLNFLTDATDSDSDDGDDDDDYITKAIEEQKTLYNKLTDKKGSLYQTAQDDMQQLKANLEEVKAKHAEPESDEYYLALYLLSRLNDNNNSEEDDRILDQHFHGLIPTGVLGHGSFGEVSKVTWLKRFECARKELFQDCEDSTVADSERPPNKEGKILKSCNHPHIVQCIWFWENENALKKKTKTSCILMELMPEDLAAHIEVRTEVNKGGPPFALHVAIDLMLQIAKAMRYLHRKKITHRDLKPANVLVRPPSCGAYLQVKLTDFGVSKHYNGTQTSAIQTPKIGTFIYAAPEVFFERTVVNKDMGQAAPKFPPRADVWSFAMIFSEILTGRCPFQGEPRFELHKRMLAEGLRPVLPENLPAYLRSCITSCWSPFPDKRPDFQTICRMLNHAKALSLEILHPTLPRSLKNRLDASSTVNVSETDSVTGHEVGQKYILIGTNFKFYVDESKDEEILAHWNNPCTGIEKQDPGHPKTSLMSLKPIHRVIMQGACWANPLNDFAYGCLTGVFLNSKYKTELIKMNVKVVEGGCLGETDTRTTTPVVKKYFWGAKISAHGKDVAHFYCTGESERRYVYLYLRYGLSKAAVISHLWLDKILVLGDKSTADSASKDAIVMGSQVLVSWQRDEHVTSTVSLSSEAS